MRNCPMLVYNAACTYALYPYSLVLTLSRRAVNVSSQDMRLCKYAVCFSCMTHTYGQPCDSGSNIHRKRPSYRIWNACFFPLGFRNLAHRVHPWIQKSISMTSGVFLKRPRQLWKKSSNKKSAGSRTSPPHSLAQKEKRKSIRESHLHFYHQ